MRSVILMCPNIALENQLYLEPYNTRMSLNQKTKNHQNKTKTVIATTKKAVHESAALGTKNSTSFLPFKISKQF